VDIIRQSRLIYMLGGFTGYLGETLANSAAWQAMLQAYESGAVIAGSSAGAMVLCQYYYDPAKAQVVQGLGLVPNSCVLPHHNTFGKGWAKLLSTHLPDAVLIGIDERTGMIDDGDGSRKVSWRVYGQGAVTLYRGGQPTEYKTGESFTLPILAL
jgi:cyanophycinase